jgi:hypothetical protein
VVACVCRTCELRVDDVCAVNVVQRHVERTPHTTCIHIHTQREREDTSHIVRKHSSYSYMTAIHRVFSPSPPPHPKANNPSFTMLMPPPYETRSSAVPLFCVPASCPRLSDGCLALLPPAPPVSEGFGGARDRGWGDGGSRKCPCSYRQRSYSTKVHGTHLAVQERGGERSAEREKEGGGQSVNVPCIASELLAHSCYYYYYSI